MNHESHINWLEIKNFKSIKATNFDCKRINVFIGKPNVGKSNILEAVGLLGGMNSWKEDKLFSDFARYETVRNLFYDNVRTEMLEVNSNLGFLQAHYHASSIDAYEFVFSTNKNLIGGYKIYIDNLGSYTIEELKQIFQNEVALKVNNNIKFGVLSNQFLLNNNGKLIGSNFRENIFQGNIKKYHFKKDINKKDTFSAFLKPPSGNNLFTIVENEKLLSDEIADIFYAYGLNLLIDSETSELSVQKIIGRTSIRMPYSLMADTLQRYVFNLLAIKTNKNSIIVLEEPEAHSFPTYISKVGSEIVNDKNNNQYFIATHSPYLLQEFIENTDPNDLALFVCDYKNYETVIKSLTREEIDNITETDIDLFYNIKAFQNDND